MMFDVHPLHPSRPSPSRKLNRENRIKNTCFSNSHSNIAPSSDKRPLFVQIPATPSASLVSTSLPIQCLRPTNFFFYRGIFLNSFLRNLLQPPRNLLQYVPKGVKTRSEPTLSGIDSECHTDHVYSSPIYSSGRWMSGPPLSGFFLSSGFLSSGFLSPGFFPSGCLPLSAAFLPG